MQCGKCRQQTNVQDVGVICYDCAYMVCRACFVSRYEGGTVFVNCFNCGSSNTKIGRRQHEIVTYIVTESFDIDGKVIAHCIDAENTKKFRLEFEQCNIEWGENLIVCNGEACTDEYGKELPFCSVERVV